MVDSSWVLGDGLGHRLWDDLKQPPAGNTLDSETVVACVDTQIRRVRDILPLARKKPLAIQKRRSTGKRSVVARRASGTTEEKPIALTLKVDNATYVRLSALRATQRRSKQKILRQALVEYLDRAGV